VFTILKGMLVNGKMDLPSTKWANQAQYKRNRTISVAHATHAHKTKLNLTGSRYSRIEITLACIDCLGKSNKCYETVE